MESMFSNHKRQTREKLEKHEKDIYRLSKEINQLTREILLMKEISERESSVVITGHSKRRSIKQILFNLIDYLNLETEGIPGTSPGVRFIKKED